MMYAFHDELQAVKKWHHSLSFHTEHAEKIEPVSFCPQPLPSIEHSRMHSLPHACFFCPGLVFHTQYSNADIERTSQKPKSINHNNNKQVKGHKNHSRLQSRNMCVSSSSRRPPFYVALPKVKPERRGSNNGGQEESAPPTISSTSSHCNKKRSRSQYGSLDMSELVHVSQQIQDSITFPVIRFPSLDCAGSDVASDSNSVTENDCSVGEEDEDDDCDVEYLTMPRKRHCRGLVRCQRSYNLSSLVDLFNADETAAAATSMNGLVAERRGSTGSML